MENVCKRRNVNYKFVKSKTDWTEDTYLKVSNQGTASFSKLEGSGLVDKILDEQLFADLQKKLKTSA